MLPSPSLVATLVLVPCASLIMACNTPKEIPPPPTLREILDDHPEAHISVAYRNLETNERVSVNAEREVHAASTMKIAILIEVFRQADAGRLSLDDGIEIHDEFTSIADGSTYSLSVEDDSEKELYQHIGQSLSLRELSRRMIVRSSNLATNLLVEWIGADSAQKTIEDLGTRTMKVRRGVEDIPAFRAGLNNTTCARDLEVLLTAIARHEAAAPESCEEMMRILENQEFGEMIPAGVPDLTRVAHKTGQITGIQHDAAIVFPAGAPAYVLVVLTEGIEDPQVSARVVRGVSRNMFRFHMEPAIDTRNEDAIDWDEILGNRER